MPVKRADAWGRVLEAVHIPVLVAVREGEQHAWPHVAVVGRRRDGAELGVVEDLVGGGRQRLVLLGFVLRWAV